RRPRRQRRSGVRRRGTDPPPPPLPPETRTVGQLVAETIRFYAHHFWRSVSLGISVGIIDAVAVSLSRANAVLFEVLVAGPLLTISFVAASVLISERPRPPARTLGTAWVAGTLGCVPCPFLSLRLVLPALAWLAFVGLVVPVIVIE